MVRQARGAVRGSVVGSRRLLADGRERERGWKSWAARGRTRWLSLSRRDFPRRRTPDSPAPLRLSHEYEIPALVAGKAQVGIFRRLRGRQHDRLAYLGKEALRI